MDSLLPGSALEMLVLEVIAQGPSYGYEIAQTVAGRSEGTFEMKEGSLYPALHRLERDKLVSAAWKTTDKRRRARVYSLTAAGRKRLGEATESWSALAKGVGRLLRYA
jgi:transcriptional regulator